jgi:hypothetical protein
MRTAILFLLLLASPCAASTHYISTAGADTNNGTSTGTAWAHVPGMRTATSNAAAYSAVAGDIFILRGCDVWFNASFPLVLSHGGAIGNPVIVTVDQTWFNTTNCPSQWNRPIFDGHTSAGSSTPTEINGTGGQTSGCISGNGNHFVVFTASNITLDWIEERNLYYNNDAEGTCYNQNGWFLVSSADRITVSHGYQHEWKMGLNDADELVQIEGTPQCPHCLLTLNVTNNCLSTPGNGTNQPGGAMSFINVTYSILSCMSNAYKPVQAGEFGWNEITKNGESPDGTIHANCIETLAAEGDNNGTYYIHDNRIHDNFDCEGLQIGNPGEIDYVWNNLWYNDIQVGANGPQVPQSETPISMFFFNNTVVDWDSCIHDASHGYSWSNTFRSQNNLCIDATGSASSGSPSATSVTISNNIGMTDAAATSAGYKNTQSPFVYAPTSSGSATVGTGVNLTSVWPAGFPTVDSSIVCTQQTINTVIQSVCTGTAKARPVSAAWDVGAYQFSGSPPPPGLLPVGRRATGIY